MKRLLLTTAFVLAFTQSMAESAPDTDALVRALLWGWSTIVFPVAIAVIVNQTLLPTDPQKGTPSSPEKRGHGVSLSPGERAGLSSEVLLTKEGLRGNSASGEPHRDRSSIAPATPKKRLFVPDAFTNPAYVQFALKVSFAAMTCYILYTGLDWSGIHTAFITCCFIALESNTATMRKARLRLAGCAIGGLFGFLSIMYLIPHMESIVSLVLLMAAGSAVAGWVAAGSERISYAGLQIALAFFMCLFQGFAPDTEFHKIRDRIVGIVLGIIVTSVVFHYLWPEPDRPADQKLTAQPIPR